MCHKVTERAVPANEVSGNERTVPENEASDLDDCDDYGQVELDLNDHYEIDLSSFGGYDDMMSHRFNGVSDIVLQQTKGM